MTYNSIHEYLDAVFADIPNPSNEDIIYAKKQYYKLWHRHYNRRRRQRRKEFTLGFDAKTLKRINDQKGTQSVSKFLYTCVYGRLDESKSSYYNSEDLTVIHQKLMQLIALVEQLLELEESPQIEHILERIEALELQFSKLIA